MTGRERVRAALEGRRAELAVGMAYPEIPLRDRSDVEAAVPWWTLEAAEPDACLALIRRFLEVTGSDLWPVWWTGPRQERARYRYQREAGRDFRIDVLTGQRSEVFPPGRGGSGQGRGDCDRPRLSDDEVYQCVRIVPAEEQIASGQWDLARAVVEGLGEDCFLYSYTNTPFVLSFGKGFTETMMDVAANPAFFHRMAERLVPQQAENFRAMALLGLPGVWMQDFNAGRELISREQYRQIVLPHGQELVAEAHRHGLVAIHYFMGDPQDRAELVSAMGADVVLFEEARKGYTVDLEHLAGRLAERQVLMGNLAAETVLARADRQALTQAIAHQVAIGRARGRFIFGTGAPPTPDTSWARIGLALETARRFWAG